MNRIKKAVRRYKIPRYVVIIATKIGFEIQPNKGSSLYKKPTNEKIPFGKENWACPIGTLRLSDHWDYENPSCEKVYRTNIELHGWTWALCVNTGVKPTPWRVIEIFKNEKSNIIYKVNLRKIENEVNNAILYLKGTRPDNKKTTGPATARTRGRRSNTLNFYV